MPKLIDQVLEQIKRDVEIGDLTAIEEFLMIALNYVPEKYLDAYLTEENENA